MIEVTHDPVEALALGQRLAVLRGGLVEQVGPPAELYDRPRTRTVATALGGPPMNLADAIVAGGDGRLALRTPVGWALPVPAGRAVEPGRAVTVGVRPEHIMAAGWGWRRTGPVGGLVRHPRGAARAGMAPDRRTAGAELAGLVAGKPGRRDPAAGRTGRRFLSVRRNTGEIV